MEVQAPKGKAEKIRSRVGGQQEVVPASNALPSKAEAEAGDS